MDNNKWILAKIKKYEKLKGDSLDGWQECTEEKHKSMWEAYNLAYGQILSDLNDLIEYIPEVQDSQELWDKHSEYIDDNISSLERFAGTTVITKHEFDKMMAANSHSVKG